MKKNGTQQSESSPTQEGLFRTIFDKATDAILLWEYFGDGSDVRIVEANAMACERYGYTRQEFLKLNSKDLNTPESYEAAKSTGKLFFESGHGSFEITHRTKDGRPIPSEVSARLFNEGGRTFIVSIVRDITKRREQESLIRQLATYPISNPNPVIRTTPEGQLIFANPASAPLLLTWGVKQGDHLPSHWVNILRDTYASSMAVDMEATCGNQIYSLNIYPDTNDGYLNIYALDITRRKEMEEELKNSRDYLEKLNDSLPETIFIVRRPERHIEYVNKQVEQIYGYSPAECLRRTPEFLFATRSDYMKHSRKVSSAIRHRHSMLRTEMIQKRKTGELFPCEVIQTFSRRPDNSLGIITIVRDITEQQKIRAEITRYQQDLERMVAARTQALDAEIASRQKAEEELRSMYEREHSLSSALKQQIEERILFTRALVHELKTPLTPLLTASDFLENHLTDDTARGFARNIRTGALNMEKRVNELLDLARGEVGTLKLAYRDFDLVSLLSEIADYMGPEAKRRGQHLELDLPDQPVQMRADPDRLRQVVTNLLANSFKFTRQSGRIKLSAVAEPDGALIAVKDSGSGIEAADLPYIFQPYHRGQTSEKSRLSGLGLGLVLSKMIVELHGGQIWLKSAKGKGSTFSFKIPYHK